VELDPVLADALKVKYAGNPRVEIIEGDFLRVTLPAASRVVGNLPYYITSPILMRLFEQRGHFEQIVVMVQREVAERITASPGSRDYGLLTLTSHFYGTPKLLFKIPPGAFQPMPRVESAVIGIQLRTPPLDPAGETGFFRMAKAAFSQKRKTLVNNLKPVYGVDKVKGALDTMGLQASARAEELPLDAFVKLFLLLGLPRAAG